MKCYRCKREVPEDAKFCPKCGAPQEFTRELIDRAIGNDQAAITQLYEMTKDNVYYTIKTMISDEDTAQDLTQDTFLKAMKNLGQLNEPAAFRGWIKKIARNMTIDILRKRKVLSFSQMVSADPDEVIEFEDDRPENLPEVVIDRQETTRLIGEILSTLSAEQRVVTELFYYEGFSVREIAEELGVSQNTVKSRLKYARDKIEIGVKDLEKKGTKLYGLAPIPFLLLLLRSQDAHAAELPDTDMFLRSMQAGDTPAGAGNSFSGQSADIGGKIADTGIGAVSKSIAAKVIAGIVAAALIGGAAAGIRALDREDEPPAAAERPAAPAEMAPVTARDFEGYHTCPDTSVAFTITPLDDTRATVVLEDITPSDADPFNKEGTAVMDGEMLIMDLETQGGDRATFSLSGNRVIVQASRRYQSDVDRAISGTYVLGEKEEVEEKADIKDHIGTFMNGNDRGAGKLTVTQIDPRSVNVRLEAFRTLDAGEVSTIFEGVGYPFEDGIYIDVAGERVRFIKETQGYYTLDVPGVLRQEWDIILNYESRYVLLEEGLEGAAEIGRFTGTYTKDLGSYSEALILSAEEGALRYQVGNSYHGGWMTSLCPEYSITGNELRATKEDRTYTFVLNEDGSITFTASDIDFYNGVYERNDEYDETEEYPEGYP